MYVYTDVRFSFDSFLGKFEHVRIRKRLIFRILLKLKWKERRERSDNARYILFKNLF